MAIAITLSSAAFAVQTSSNGKSAPTVQSGVPEVLISSARYQLDLRDAARAATMRAELQVELPESGVLGSIQLPFEGLTFRGSEAVTIDGVPTRLGPTARGDGVLILLPEKMDARSDRRSVTVRLEGVLRASSSANTSLYRLRVPPVLNATAEIEAPRPLLDSLRTNGRGQSRLTSNSLTVELGGLSELILRWGERERRDLDVTGRAETLMQFEPRSVSLSTRILVETPESSDPFAERRLSLNLPEDAFVQSVTGDGVSGWRVSRRTDNQEVEVDLISPPIVGMRIDVRYQLPCKQAGIVTLPALSLLGDSATASHQIALLNSSILTAELLTEPNPDDGLWSLQPAEACFSLRKSLGLGVPVLAVELEHAAPLQFSVTPRETRTSAELEQTLTATSRGIQWTATARIESLSRPTYVYDFELDPRIVVSSVRLTEKDVERPSRFVTLGSRLIVFAFDDRLGSRLISLTGELRLEAGEISPIPTLDLRNAQVSRRELVLSSSSDQWLQVRRREESSLITRPSDAEWEPQKPASVRLPLTVGAESLELRWTSPSPILVVEFITVPERTESDVVVDWNLESTRRFPASLTISLPRGVQIADSSDFTDENRRPGEADRVLIDLRPKRAGRSRGQLRMFVPPSAEPADSWLPRLPVAGTRIQCWVAVPIARLNSVQFGGDFVDSLPDGTPADWKSAVADGKVVVFPVPRGSWRLASPDGEQPLGRAAIEVAASREGSRWQGSSQWIFSAARAGVLTISPPANGKIEALWCAGGIAIPDGTELEQGLLVRPSRPAVISCLWSLDGAGAGFDPCKQGPVLDHVDVQPAFVAISDPQSIQVVPSKFARSSRRYEIAAIHLSELLKGARTLPIGVRPPEWLLSQVHLARKLLVDADEAAGVTADADAWLKSLPAQAGSPAASDAVAPDASMSVNLPLEIVTGSVLEVAADPSLQMMEPEQPAGHPVRNVLRHVIFLVAWVIAWGFVFWKGDAWARERRIADRLAQDPAFTLFGLGLIWWLFLTPSEIGAVLALFFGLWTAFRLGQSVRRNRKHSTATA